MIYAFVKAISPHYFNLLYICKYVYALNQRLVWFIAYNTLTKTFLQTLLEKYLQNQGY